MRVSMLLILLFPVMSFGSPESDRRWFEAQEVLADQGNAKAQYNLGLMYDLGKGVPEDDKKAVEWYRLAADQGNAKAQDNLGLMYDLGEGVPEDDKEAVKWYRLAADQGNADAQSNLGVKYDTGEGVPEDDKQAVKWYRLAANQGNADAQSNLGSMYADGRGVIEDDKAAMEWYRLAAEQGLAGGQYNLGFMYGTGEGVTKDYKETMKWYRLAADQGHAKARSMIAVLYARGFGTEINFAKAVEYDAENAHRETINHVYTLRGLNRDAEAIATLKSVKSFAEENSFEDIEVKADWALMIFFYDQEDYIRAKNTIVERVQREEFPIEDKLLAYVNYLKVEHRVSNFTQFTKIFRIFLAHLAQWKILENEKDAGDLLYFQALHLFDQYEGSPQNLLEFLTDIGDQYDGAIGAYIYTKIGDIHRKLTESRQALFYYTSAIPHLRGNVFFQTQLHIYGIKHGADFSKLGTDLKNQWKTFEQMNTWELMRALITSELNTIGNGEERTKSIINYMVKKSVAEFGTLDGEHNYLVTMDFLGLYYGDVSFEKNLEIEVYERAFKRFGLDLYSTPLEEIPNLELLKFKERSVRSLNELEDPKYVESKILVFEEIIRRLELKRKAANSAESESDLSKSLRVLSLYYLVSSEPLLYKSTITRGIASQLDALVNSERCNPGFFLDWNEVTAALKADEITDHLDMLGKAHIRQADSYRGLEETYKCQLDIGSLLLANVYLNVNHATDSPLAFQLSQIFNLNQFTFAHNLGISKAGTQSPNSRQLIGTYNQLTLDLDQTLSQESASSLDVDGRSIPSYQEIKEKRRAIRRQLILQEPSLSKQLLSNPVTILAVSAKLQVDEALIKFSRPNDGPLTVWVVTQAGYKFLVLETDASELKNLVATVRASLSQESITSPLDIRPYETEVAYNIYMKIWEPLEKHLQAIKRVYVLPTDELGAIPLEVLPVDRPSAAVISPLDFSSYRDLTWLNDRYEFVYPTSVGSFVRKNPKISTNKLSFLGVGNPVVAAATVSAKVEDTFAELALKGYVSRSPIHDLLPLPQSETQLRALADVFDHRPKLLLGRDALESNLYKLKLRAYSVIAFATHGVMSDSAGAEASLILSPPEFFTAKEDGILTTSEIARLDLSADLVILSACNTATETETRGLNSIAASFTHAGARNVLASHWSIEVNATTQLLSSFARLLIEEPELKVSGALQAARSNMIHDSPNLFNPHPMFWGAFTLKGVSVN